MMDIGAKGTAYHFLGTQDKHLIDLFHWIKIIQDLAEEVRASDKNRELYDELCEINYRLIHEVGVRVVEIFP